MAGRGGGYGGGGFRDRGGFGGGGRGYGGGGRGFGGERYVFPQEQQRSRPTADVESTTCVRRCWVFVDVPSLRAIGCLVPWRADLSFHHVSVMFSMHARTAVVTVVWVDTQQPYLCGQVCVPPGQRFDYSACVVSYWLWYSLLLHDDTPVPVDYRYPRFGFCFLLSISNTRKRGRVGTESSGSGLREGRANRAFFSSIRLSLTSFWLRYRERYFIP